MSIHDLGMLLARASEPDTWPDDGIVPDLPAAEYHKIDRASASRLKVLEQRSPAHVRYEATHHREPTDAQLLGTAIHFAVLQPDLFDSQYVRGIEGDGRTKAVKDRRAELEAAHPFCEILKPSDYDACMAIRDTVHTHPTASLLFGGHPEETALWTDPASGVRCKSRFDERDTDTEVVVDLKSTVSAHPDEFTKAIYAHRYYRQGALYVRGARTLGLPVRHFVIVAVEKEPPYGVGVYRVRDDALRAGDDELAPLLARYAECERSGEWPAYPTGVTEISLPSWAWNQIDERTLRLSA